MEPRHAPSDRHAGGYDYRDRHLSGFSLTHLSGAGCALYGDFPFLPTTEPLSASPAAPGPAASRGASSPASPTPASEGSPGHYSVRLNPVRGGAIDAALTATTRTGMARFTFPPQPARERPDRRRRQRQSRTTSPRCRSTPPAARSPARPPAATSAPSGLATGSTSRPSSTAPSTPTAPGRARRWRRARPPRPTAGALDRPGQHRAGRRLRQLRHPPQPGRHRPGRRLLRQRRRGARATSPPRTAAPASGGVAGAAERAWNRALGRIRVGGGSRAQRRHLLHGALPRAARAAHLRRRRRPLHRHGRRGPRRRRPHPVRGLLGLGHLPHADPAARDADAPPRERHRRLDARRRRAERLPAALVLRQRAEHDDGRRPGRRDHRLGRRLRRPRLRRAGGAGGDGEGARARAAAAPTATTSSARASPSTRRWATSPSTSTSSAATPTRCSATPTPSGARRRRRSSTRSPTSRSPSSRRAPWATAATYRAFIRARATGATSSTRDSGQIEPRFANGAFPPRYDNLRGGGFVEGNSIQYTWMVPHDPAGLFAAMGGRARAASRLDRFLRKLNGSAGATHADHALLGNEPNLNVPWLYDWAGRPFKTQAAVRRALLPSTAPPRRATPATTTSARSSSWYVFGALGLYPEVPGVGLLAIGSPLFRQATVRLANGRKLRIVASALRREAATGNAREAIASCALSLPDAPYIQGMRFNGHAYGRPWTTFCAWPAGRRLATGSGPRPNRAWGDSAAALPPSFGPRRPMPRGSLRPLTAPHGFAPDGPLGARRPDRARRRDPLRQPRPAELPPRRGDHRGAGHPRQLRRHAARGEGERVQPAPLLRARLGLGEGVRHRRGRAALADRRCSAPPPSPVAYLDRRGSWRAAAPG